MATDRPVIIFGTGMLARLATHYFRSAGRVIAGYTDDRCGPVEGRNDVLPLVPFETVADRFPPSRFDLFVAVGNRNLNSVRERFMDRARAMGYRLATLVHFTAFVAGNARLGENCLVLEHCTVGPFSEIGDGTLIFARTLINHDCMLGRCCYLSACLIGGCVSVGGRTFIGIGAVVRDQVRIGEDCLLGAGALVLSDVPDRSFVKEIASPILDLDLDRAFNFGEGAGHV